MTDMVWCASYLERERERARAIERKVVCASSLERERESARARGVVCLLRIFYNAV